MSQISPNQISLGGNLCADPELKQVGQNQVLALRLASNRPAAQGQTRAIYVNAELWDSRGTRASALHGMLARGRAIHIEGELDINSWEKDGVKHERPVIKIRQLHLVGPNPNGPGQPQPQAAPQPQQAPAPQYGQPAPAPAPAPAPQPAVTAASLQEALNDPAQRAALQGMLNGGAAPAPAPAPAPQPVGNGVPAAGTAIGF